MPYQETICITSKSLDESIDQLMNLISDAWPQETKPQFTTECLPNVSAVLVLIRDEEELCSMMPIIVAYQSSKVPVIVACDEVDALQNLLDDLDVLHLNVKASPESISGLLCGIIQNSAENSQLRSQVKLMRELQRSLKDDLCFLQDELETAATIQKEFMSYGTPNISGITFDTYWKPAGVVSGDMYDITKLDDSHVSFFISDSIGHGISAAMLAMMLNRTLSVHRFNPVTGKLTEPSQMMEYLNEALLLRTGSSARFATAIYGILNTKTHSLTFAGAGHPPALLSHHDGKATLLESQGPLLGVFESPSFKDQEIALGHGDTLVMYSDGFEHIKPMSEESCSGLPKHVQAMHEICITSRDEIVKSLLMKMDPKKPVQDDDLTLIALKVDVDTSIQIAA